MAEYPGTMATYANQSHDQSCMEQFNSDMTVIITHKSQWVEDTRVCLQYASYELCTLHDMA